jgi:hypothetical protein
VLRFAGDQSGRGDGAGVDVVVGMRCAMGELQGGNGEWTRWSESAMTGSWTKCEM